MLITVDIEDHTAPDQGKRFAKAVGPLLESLALRELRATFFVVGSLAKSWGCELRELAAHGHEVGVHGYVHRYLRDLGPTAARDDLARGRDAVGEVLGRLPAGYRAPYFGLTAETPWAPDLIREVGFLYSSSVLPAWNPQAGIMRAPRLPFRWSNGLVEFPARVFGIGPIAVPLLGGAYLRLAPGAVFRLAARQGIHQQGQWTYAHPYDFDVDEPFSRYPGQTALSARLLFARRRLMLDRILGIASRSARPLGDLAADARFVAGLEEFSFEEVTDKRSRAARQPSTNS